MIPIAKGITCPEHDTRGNRHQSFTVWYTWQQAALVYSVIPMATGVSSIPMATGSTCLQYITHGNRLNKFTVLYSRQQTYLFREWYTWQQAAPVYYIMAIGSTWNFQIVREGSGFLTMFRINSGQQCSVSVFISILNASSFFVHLGSAF